MSFRAERSGVEKSGLCLIETFRLRFAPLKVTRWRRNSPLVDAYSLERHEHLMINPQAQKGKVAEATCNKSALQRTSISEAGNLFLAGLLDAPIDWA